MNKVKKSNGYSMNFSRNELETIKYICKLMRLKIDGYYKITIPADVLKFYADCGQIANKIETEINKE